jgi:putative transposase
MELTFRRRRMISLSQFTSQCMGSTTLTFRVPHPSRSLRRVGGLFEMTQSLHRRYGTGNLHFITASCYRRLPLLNSARARNCFLRVLGEVRAKFRFALAGYVVMPEHIHLLISEPKTGDPGTVMQALKQRVSRALGRRNRKRAAKSQLRLWPESSDARRSFWQRRFYDFNVWSRKKKIEKIAYMHMNPVKRGLVAHPKDWRWSSYASYQRSPEALIDIDPVD